MDGLIAEAGCVALLDGDLAVTVVALLVLAYQYGSGCRQRTTYHGNIPARDVEPSRRVQVQRDSIQPVNQRQKPLWR